MPRAMQRIGIGVLGLGLALGLAVVGLGARAAEGALHPTRGKIALVCPCVAHVRCRDAQVTSGDGTVLKAWYYEPDHPNGGAVLMLHGVGGTRGDVVALGTVFEKAGYAVLVPDLRGHGESGGISTYGALEEADVRAWADWMQGQPGIGRLYGFGASLGASVLLDSLKSETRFRAVIAESAYTDFPSIANERIARAAPDGLGWLAGPFVEAGILWARLRYGADLRQASAVAGVRKTKTPMLIAHGLEDRLTAPANSRVLAAANPARAELWLMAGAGHANLWSTSRAEFEARILGWFAAHP